jgi:hypothetical protein
MGIQHSGPLRARPGRECRNHAIVQAGPQDRAAHSGHATTRSFFAAVTTRDPSARVDALPPSEQRRAPSLRAAGGRDPGATGSAAYFFP